MKMSLIASAWMSGPRRSASRRTRAYANDATGRTRGSALGLACLVRERAGHGFRDRACERLQRILVLGRDRWMTPWIAVVVDVVGRRVRSRPRWHAGGLVRGNLRSSHGCRLLKGAIADRASAAPEAGSSLTGRADDARTAVEAARDSQRALRDRRAGARGDRDAGTLARPAREPRADSALGAHGSGRLDVDRPVVVARAGLALSRHPHRQRTLGRLR